MQTTAPMLSATAMYAWPVQPTVKKTRHVAIKLAIVIPEIGLEEEPSNPTKREETVTKKNPRKTTRIEETMFPPIAPGLILKFKIAQISATIKIEPNTTNDVGRSR